MSSQTKSALTKIVKNYAELHGFDSCGISRAEFLEDQAPLLEKWLRNGMHGTMSYMENHFDKRLDPTRLVPGAKSVVSLLYNYYPQEDLGKNDSYKFSKYSYGEDYHNVIKDILRKMVHELKDQIGEFSHRIFVDSAPVMERQWAQRSGLGWLGKNSLLINPKKGSFYFLAEIVCDLELEYDVAMKDFCGTCDKCIQACPTDAISTPYIVDGSKCISYLTIELKENIPQTFKGAYENWIFGCDICQDVCPWNRFSTANRQPRFEPPKELKEYSTREWDEIKEEQFKEIFRNSAVKRTKFKGLKRNIEFITRNPARSGA